MINKFVLVILLWFLVFPCFAITPEAKGLAIVVEVDRRDTGFVDSQADMQMVLKNRHGDVSNRKLRIRTLEVGGDGDKSLIIFDTPRDVKGMVFLSFTHAITPDDQWLYLPALKRVKRITSTNKSGPFMGSEFSYEDLTSLEVERFNYKYLRDGTIGNQDCFVVEFYPQYKHSGYTRQIAWIEKKHYYAVKIEYYDRKDALLKTQIFNDYHQYLGRYWRAHEMNMVNHQTGKSTWLGWSSYQFRNAYSDRDFDRNALRRVR